MAVDLVGHGFLRTIKTKAEKSFDVNKTTIKVRRNKKPGIDIYCSPLNKHNLSH